MGSSRDKDWQPKWSECPPGLLTIDCGNSTIDCLLRGEKGEVRRRLPHGDNEGLEVLLGSSVHAVVAASVVADRLAGVESLARKLGVAFHIVGRDIECPLDIAYPEPQTLGVDRWVAAFAATSGFGGACIVIDCGTALTIDLVDGEGTFRGGMIAPGIATMAFGLGERAPSLPRADLAASPVQVPVSSSDAVNTGVLTAFLGTIDRGVVALAEGAGVNGPLLVITGGDAEIYIRHGRLPVQHVPDLVHRGLAELFQATGK